MPRERNEAGRFVKVVTKYEVTVWNQTNGDIEAKRWDATEAELRDLEEYYDEPWHEVVIDREWEETED